MHEKHQSVCDCVRINIMFFIDLAFNPTRKSRKSTVTCKRQILSCSSKFIYVTFSLTTYKQVQVKLKQYKFTQRLKSG